MKKKVLFRICLILLRKLVWDDHQYRKPGIANIWPPSVRMAHLWVRYEEERRQRIAASGHTYTVMPFPAKFYRKLRKNAADIYIMKAAEEHETANKATMMYETACNTTSLITDGYTVKTNFGPDGDVYLVGVRGPIADFWR